MMIRVLLAVLLLMSMAPAGEPVPLIAFDRRPMVHPCLLADGATLAALREAHRGEGVRAALAARVVAEAEGMAALPLPERVLEGRRLLGVSRTVLRRVLTTSLAWRITGDPRHLETARVTMRAAAAFSDWNPSHFLDVAEMAAGLALGLDWLHADLPAADRDAIAAALISKALGAVRGDESWISGHNNWNQVCHGGLVLAALAVRERAPEPARAALARALAHAGSGLAVYAPDGVYPEGPGYWDYGTIYTVLTIAALESALGDDGGLGAAPGLAASAEFVSHAQAPSGRVFNFSDGGAGGPGTVSAPLAWFAGRLGRPELLWRQRNSLAERLRQPPRPEGQEHRFLPLLLLWPEPSATASRILARSWTGNGINPVAIHRSGWDADATWVGIKAGTPGANHGHMDAGAIVVEALGRRWVEDPGAENYNRLEQAGIRIWDARQDGQRWTVLRHHNRSHATLMVDDLRQKVSASAAFTGHDLAGAARWSQLDLGGIYAGQLHAARRGVRLEADGAVIFRDEVRADPGRRIRSGFPTRATPMAVAPGLLRLDQDGVAVHLRIDAPAGAQWTVEGLVPTRREETPMTGFSMCSVTVIATGATQAIQVSLHRGPPVPIELTPLDRW